MGEQPITKSSWSRKPTPGKLPGVIRADQRSGPVMANSIAFEFRLVYQHPKRERHSCFDITPSKRPTCYRKAEATPPLFFVSVASKALRARVSRLASTLTRWPASVDSKGVSSQENGAMPLSTSSVLISVHPSTRARGETKRRQKICRPQAIYLINKNITKVIIRQGRTKIVSLAHDMSG